MERNDQKAPPFRSPAERAGGTVVSKSNPMPSLLGAGFGTYEVHPENFALSLFGHIALIALLLWVLHMTGLVGPKVVNVQQDVILVGPPPELYHVGKGGQNAGGGGDASKLKASAGTPPKAAKTQIVPPQVLPPQTSKLQVEPTVVADLKIPQSNQIGDPLSKLLTPSNGSGVGGGIGNGMGGGVGPGRGPGVGPGVFRCCGSGVSAPRPLETPEPEFSEEARKAKYQGVVVLEIIVGADGRVRNPRVVRSLGMGLDEKAREKVLTWKFAPATKDGRPVAVEMNIEVSFNLY